jgi:hypothetical protein
MEEFIAIQIMVAQAQIVYPKLDPFDPNCQHIAFLNSHLKSFSKQFKNTDMRHFKFHWEFIYGKIFSNEYFPVISRIGPQAERFFFVRIRVIACKRPVRAITVLFL